MTYPQVWNIPEMKYTRGGFSDICRLVKVFYIKSMIIKDLLILPYIRDGLSVISGKYPSSVYSDSRPTPF